MEEVKEKADIVKTRLNMDAATGKSLSSLRKFDKFAEAYLDYTRNTYMHGTRAAIAAGYSPKGAVATASRILKDPYVVAKMAEIERSRNETNKITIEWIKSEYVQLYKTCLKESDRTNAKNCLADLGKMLGAFVELQRTEIVENRAQMTEEEEEQLEDIARQYKIKLSG